VAVYESPGPGRVLIATGAGPLVAEPAWTRFDELEDCRCYGFDATVGRQSEFDVTETGTARVFFHDRAGVLNDPTLVGLQIMLQLYDPVAEAWEPRFRGRIDDIGAVASPSLPELVDTEISCVGVFAYLGRVKMQVGVFGEVPLPGAMTGVVFYEDGPVATGTNDPNDGGRIERLHFDAGIASSMYVAFSGNVDVNETLHDPQDTIMAALRQAADAEFWGVANVFEDRFGRSCFHGRRAYFDPDGTAAGASVGAWLFTRFDAATREDVTTGVAQIREFAWNVPMVRIVNSFVAWPGEDENGVTFDQANVEAQYRIDAPSQAAFGICPLEKGNFIIKQHKTNGNTGAEELGLVGDFYIANYAQPKRNVQRVTFKSHHPDDPRAAATWALITTCDVSDVIALTIDEAELADVDHYVQGYTVSCRPLNPGFDYVEFTPNLTPAAYYDEDTFPDD
jgi:hypothetical protein